MKVANVFEYTCEIRDEEILVLPQGMCTHFFHTIVYNIIEWVKGNAGGA